LKLTGKTCKYFSVKHGRMKEGVGEGLVISQLKQMKHTISKEHIKVFYVGLKRF